MSERKDVEEYSLYQFVEGSSRSIGLAVGEQRMTGDLLEMDTINFIFEGSLLSAVRATDVYRVVTFPNGSGYRSLIRELCRREPISFIPGSRFELRVAAHKDESPESPVATFVEGKSRVVNYEADYPKSILRIMPPSSSGKTRP